MAFIDFKDAEPGTPLASVASMAAEHRASPIVDALTALERRVIELAREDDLETLRPPRTRGWFARLILGPMPASPMLANERLESLRRLAVQAWHHGYNLPVSAQEEALAAGFSEHQVGAVLDTIGRLRAPFRRLSA
ncbi:hypothetical protein [Novosphingobium mangrovi (ex Huang et al. 2023)]|uniref:Uncharacterized protein n=1 Tax=Novosphingobium mangrovi (ex Huang et al. 2023) TaxID=2976432 RepID=A0ABT2I9L5_9SPHN|nr:hypothetical protein [Novosphingobium mangrovi (ex Huang et al. 2023)]MCT2401521.1 hypothetical protein [Novosphingobium mangrovi (ex Huang et al. 2023)]